MSHLSIINTTQNAPLADKAVLADSFISRMVGLLNRSALDQGEALIITRCQSIHMFFMKFPIDVIFIDQDRRVVGLVKRIKPFRLSPIFFKSKCAIEVPAGTISRTKTSIDDQIQINGPQ